MRKILSLPFVLFIGPQNLALLTLLTHSHQPINPCSLHFSYTGLSSPGNQQAPSPTWPLYMLPLLPQFFIHSFHSRNIQEILTENQIHNRCWRYVNKPDKALLHAWRLHSCSIPFLFLPSELLHVLQISAQSFFPHWSFFKPPARPTPSIHSFNKYLLIT